MGRATVNKVIENFDDLPLKEKEYVIEIMEKQFTEAKRAAIAKRTKEAKSNLKKGLVKRGTIKELYKDLELD